MNSSTDVSLIEQRQTLRLRLLAQRQLIAHQLGPTPEVNSGYPRSMTMRFLTRRPAALATRLLVEFASLLVDARFFR